MSNPKFKVGQLVRCIDTSEYERHINEVDIYRVISCEESEMKNSDNVFIRINDGTKDLNLSFCSNRFEAVNEPEIVEEGEVILHKLGNNCVIVTIRTQFCNCPEIKVVINISDVELLHKFRVGETVPIRIG